MVTAGSSGYQAIMSAPKYNSKTGFWEQSVTGYQPQSNDLSSLFGGSGSNSSSNNTTNSLFGSSSDSSGIFGSGSGIDDYINKAKDVSNFQLGQNENLATFYSGLRNTEAQNNFGRQYQLNQQQNNSNEAINKLQQDATTSRLQDQLNSQQTMQQNDFNQQNLFRSQSAALALRGLQ